MKSETGHQQTHAEVKHEPDHSGGGNPLLRLDPGMAIWTWIVFFIFLFILGKFAWKPILKSLDEREKKIKKSLDDAEKARIALEEASQKQQEIINQGEKEAMGIVQKARDSSQQVAVQIQNKAKQEAEEIIEKAKKDITQQKEQAVNELRREAAGLAISAASKLIETNLDDDKNRKLVDAYIKELTQRRN
jgi:F-type H+-transporting ATPase subunit b